MGQDFVNRTYQLRPELAQRVKDVATRLSVWDSDLVAAALSRALDDLEAGRWQPARRPAWFALEDPGAARA